MARARRNKIACPHCEGTGVCADTFGARLRAVRIVKGLSAAEVALRCAAAGYRVGRDYIGKLERGDRKKPAYEVVVTLAQALGVPLEELTGKASGKAA